MPPRFYTPPRGRSASHRSYALRLAAASLSPPRAEAGRALEAWIGVSLAVLHAMRARFKVARALLSRARTVFEDLGGVGWLAAVEEKTGEVELLAGDAEAAERAARRLVEISQHLDPGVQSTAAARAALALYELGRYDEAEDHADLSEGTVTADDILGQAEWRQVRARLLARAGGRDRAEALAREAVAYAFSTDSPNMQADALVVQAEVLELAERREKASSALKEALRLYEQKGNIVSAGTARGRLAELGPA